MSGLPQLSTARSLRIDAAHALALAETAAIEHPRVAAGLRMMAATFHGDAQRLEAEAALYSGSPTHIICTGLLRGNADLEAA